MAFKQKFKEFETKTRSEEIRHYYTAQGNQCEIQKYFGIRRTGSGNKSLIRARSIESFIAELKDGTEVMGATTLTYKTDETDISHHSGVLAFVLTSSPSTIAISAISENDGKRLFKANQGIISGVQLNSLSEESFAGINWILKDPTISRLEAPNTLKGIFRVISWGSYLEEIDLTIFLFQPSTRLFHFARLAALKELTIASVYLNSKKKELCFFKVIETLPHLKKMNYEHAPRGDNSSEIKYDCVLPTDYSCSSLGKLLNLWKPNNDVECSIGLIGNFTKLFCRYILSQLFVSIQDLTKLIFSWSFYQEKECLVSNPQMLRDTKSPFTEVQSLPSLPDPVPVPRPLPPRRSVEDLTVPTRNILVTQDSPQPLLERHILLNEPEEESQEDDDDIDLLDTGNNSFRKQINIHRPGPQVNIMTPLLPLPVLEREEPHVEGNNFFM